jgi:hypothetical protein
MNDNKLVMKVKFFLLATVLLALAAIAYAVPAEINYQGVLTDQNGNPINGVRAMQIKIYDAPTGGTLLYSEDLGNVPVQDGIYSFSFGANGTSNALTTETVAIANGTVSTFQKVLAAPTVVAGSVTVTDGTYTWDQTNGSSNENDFSVAYSPNLRRVTVTYYNGNPATGKTISAKFRAPGSGIAGALAEDNQPWIEVSLAGVAQTPRQKVLTVPFASLASQAIELMPKVQSKILPIESVSASVGSGSGSPWVSSRDFLIDPSITGDVNLSFSYSISSTGYSGGFPASSTAVKLTLSVSKINPATNTNQTIYFFEDEIKSPTITSYTKTIKTDKLNLDSSINLHKISLNITNIGASNWGSKNNAVINWIKADYTTY